MRDRNARLRAGLHPSYQLDEGQQDVRIQVDLNHLRSMENRVRSLTFLPRQPANSVLNGRHASRLRGRGLNFEELRGYLAGDDPRTIDWKVTARTGEPHVRVYSEERDKPALLVVDQRMSMFFGTRHNMKSVTAAEAAALAAYRILDHGDRLGGIVFGDEILCEIRPKRSKVAMERFLTALTRANNLLRADAPVVEAPMLLNLPLAAVARLAKRDHLVVVISDFDGLDETTEKLVANLARHNDLILCPVTDPISDEVPEGTTLVVSDGELQVEVDTTAGETYRRLEEFTKGRLTEVLSWSRKFGVPIFPLNAGEDTVLQLSRLTGRRKPGGGPR
ncbi:DUF58 domain-containing protein [Roseibium sp. SCP14]|uniref:DUF58 domain-containing protein n=1 Tax=Roseibium sp. SCP14 TaxID=3141375 RepID=UPI0033372736